MFFSSFFLYCKTYFQPHEVSIVALLSKVAAPAIAVVGTKKKSSSKSDWHRIKRWFVVFISLFFPSFSCIHSLEIHRHASILAIIVFRFSGDFHCTLWFCSYRTYVYQFLSTIRIHQTHFTAITHINGAKSEQCECVCVCAAVSRQ